VNPALIAALIQQMAVPELVGWLKARAAAGKPITDADILVKLGVDADTGIAIGQKYLDAHPNA
jgi:hypothetical protein